jgi:hypothetical protein
MLFSFAISFNARSAWSFFWTLSGWPKRFDCTIHDKLGRFPYFSNNKLVANVSDISQNHVTGQRPHSPEESRTANAAEIDQGFQTFRI